MKNKSDSALEILTVLHQVARVKGDPKPALREMKDCPQASKLADHIEAHFSQSKALWLQGDIISPAQLITLSEAESQDRLAEGYETLISEVKKANINAAYGSCPDLEDPNETKSSKRLPLEDLAEFWEKLALSSAFDIRMGEILDTIAESTTSKSLQKACKDIKNAMYEDGKSLQEALEKTKVFGKISEMTAGFGERTGKLHEVAKPLAETLRRECQEKIDKVDWKLVGAGLAGLVLGAVLTQKK